MPLITTMKHLLLGAFALISVAACGGVVVVEGEPSGNSGQGGSGTAATTGSGENTGGTTASGETTASGVPADDCSTSCGSNDGSTCACVRTCPSNEFGKGISKIACKPISGGIIECVCTLNGGNFSGICYEKNNAACNFEQGCCANYFSGK